MFQRSMNEVQYGRQLESEKNSGRPEHPSGWHLMETARLRPLRLTLVPLCILGQGRAVRQLQT